MLQVVYWDQRSLLKSYARPLLPEGVYRYQLHSGSTAKRLEFEKERIIQRWLSSTSPSIAAPVAKAVLDNGR